MEGYVSQGVAVKDVNRFLDYRKVSDKRREEFKDQVDSLVEMVMDGDMVVNDDCSITYKIAFTEDLPWSELKFMPRVKTRVVHEILRNHVKGSDGDGRVYAYLAAHSGITFGEVRLLDSFDSSRLSSLALFLM